MIRPVVFALTLPIAALAPIASTAAATAEEPVLHARDFEERMTPSPWVRVSTGGFVGMVTFSGGISVLRELLSLGASYGWVPPHGDTRAAHLATVTVTLRPLRVSPTERLVVYPIYTAAGLFFGRNVRDRVDVVEDSPSVRWGLLAFGAEVGFRERRDAFVVRHSLFVEEITLGPYLAGVVNNSGMHVLDAFSTALGYRASF